MAGLFAVFTPIYVHDFQFQRYVAGLTQSVDQATRTDGELRALVLQRAHALGLPVTEGDVQIVRSAGAVRIGVRYLVPVKLPGYAVNLHFYPSGGGRP